MHYKEKGYVTNYSILSVLMLFLLWSAFNTLCVSQHVIAQITNPIEGKSINGFVTYRNSALALKVQHPSNWTVTEENNDTIKFRPSSKSIPYFSILTKPLPSQIKTLANLTRDQTTTIATYATINQSTPIILAGNLAHKVLYTFTKGQYVEKWMQLWTIKDRNEYIVTYVGQPSDYSKYLPIVQDMVNTIGFGHIKMSAATPNVTTSANATANNATRNELTPGTIIPGIL
jgi:hypothetical protein